MSSLIKVLNRLNLFSCDTDLSDSNAVVDKLCDLFFKSEVQLASSRDQ